MHENEAVRRAFEIVVEAIRQAKESDLGNDPEWSDEERQAIHGSLDVISQKFHTLAVIANPR